MTPRVTVLMPIHNVEKHLRAALDSVLAQTFTDFELLIIDDCSTDSTPAILDTYTDPRIIRLRNAHNLGLVASLNRGIAAARGTYLARMDGDDICLPGRLAAQVAHMDAHPDIVLLGTKYVHIDDDDAYVYGGAEAPPPPEPGTRGYLRWSLLWMTSIQHPTALIRRAALGDLRYDAAFFTAEDYELWTRLGRLGAVERLPDVLLRYRVNPAGISVTKRERQLATHFSITYREICLLLGETLPEDLMRFLFRMVIPQPQDPSDTIAGISFVAALDLFTRIRAAFVSRHTLQPDERSHINRETQRVYRRIMAYSRASHQRDQRNAARAWLLRRSPRLFAALLLEFGLGKLGLAPAPRPGKTLY